MIDNSPNRICPFPLDGPDRGITIAGLSTSIYNFKGKVNAAWLSYNNNYMPEKTFASYAIVSETNTPNRIGSDELGQKSAPLVVDSNAIAFGCQSRICKTKLFKNNPRLASGSMDFSKSAALVVIENIRYIATSKTKKIVLVQF